MVVLRQDSSGSGTDTGGRGAVGFGVGVAFPVREICHGVEGSGWGALLDGGAVVCGRRDRGEWISGGCFRLPGSIIRAR